MDKEYYIRIKESEYMDIPIQFRERATAIFNDHDEYKDNPIFKQLYKTYKKAKKDLETFKFNQRHGI